MSSRRKVWACCTEEAGPTPICSKLKAVWDKSLCMASNKSAIGAQGCLERMDSEVRAARATLAKAPRGPVCMAKAVWATAAIR